MLLTLEMSGSSRRSLASLLQPILDLLGRFPLALLQLIFRLSVASVFFMSGHSKILSWQTTILLFANEYRVSVLSPEMAATISATFELGCSTLIAFGLFTRLATLPLLGMVFVIQTFVYPENWVEHLTWAAMLIFILTRGPGPISLDRLMKPLFFGRECR